MYQMLPVYVNIVTKYSTVHSHASLCDKNKPRYEQCTGSNLINVTGYTRVSLLLTIIHTYCRQIDL